MDLATEAPFLRLILMLHRVVMAMDTDTGPISSVDLTTLVGQHFSPEQGGGQHNLATKFQRNVEAAIKHTSCLTKIGQHLLLN